MPKSKKKNSKHKNPRKGQEEKKEKKEKQPLISGNIKKMIGGMLLLLFALIGVFGFYGLAGYGGELMQQATGWLFGRSGVFVPFVLFLSALVCFRTRYENFILPLFLAVLFFFLSISGMAAGLSENGKEAGGMLGFILSSPLNRALGDIVPHIIFLMLFCAGAVIFMNLLHANFSFSSALKRPFTRKDIPEEPSMVRKVFSVSEDAVKNTKEAAKDNKGKKKKEELEIKTKDVSSSFLMPPLELLSNGDEESDPGDTKRNASIIKKTLSDFDISVTMGEVNVGPTVTQYTLKPAEGVKLSRITSLSDDLALSLAMHPVRTEAPIPGKSLVGIEVPNRKRAQITLGGLLKRKEYFDMKDLSFVVGKNVSGNPIYADLSKMPHLLVSGSTGSGKTIFLNTLLLSLIYKNPPQDLRFILIDPKRVEFSLYADLPHLLTPVIYDAEKSVSALNWLIGEMERRFKVLSEVGSRNITSYREVAAKNNELEPMPYIVLVVDELADLMATKGNEMEAGIVRIAQMARAVGIHLVIATQRPSVEVITGLIKANITSRISFRVASQVDSRTVLDMAGAEKLLGSGDMLFLSTENSKPRRIQAPYVSEKEAKDIISWLKENVEKEEDVLSENLEETLAKSEAKEGLGGEEDDDVLYEEAKQVVSQSGKASASLLQRRLRVGYARAARLLDILESRGIIGPAEGAKPRDVYYDKIQEEKADEETPFEGV